MQNFDMKTDATIKDVHFSINIDYIQNQYEKMQNESDKFGLYRGSHFDMNLSINNKQLENVGTGELSNEHSLSEMELKINNVLNEFPFKLEITIMSIFEWNSSEIDLEKALGKLIPIKLYEELQQHVSSIIKQAGLEDFELPPFNENTFYNQDL